MALMVCAMTEAMGQMMAEVGAEVASPVPGQPAPTLMSLEELQQTIVFDFVMAGSTSEESALFMVGDPPEEGVDLGTAIAGAPDSIEGECTVETQHAITDKPYPTARLVVASVDAKSGRADKQLIYVFVIDDRAWPLDYAALAERFEEHLRCLRRARPVSN
jgi:hypothetical protein